jgi:hypothetical protein
VFFGRQTKQGAIKKGQSRETGNIGYTRHRTKTKNTKKTHTTQNNKNLINTARDGKAVYSSYNTPALPFGFL